LSPAMTCSNKEENIIIGDFWEVLERIIGEFLSTLCAGLIITEDNIF